MSQVDDILELLEDGRWHYVDEVVKKSTLREPKVEMVLNFLAEFALIEFDIEKQKAKLTPTTLKFIIELQRIKSPR